MNFFLDSVMVSLNLLAVLILFPLNNYKLSKRNFVIISSSEQSECTVPVSIFYIRSLFHSFPFWLEKLIHLVS